MAGEGRGANFESLCSTRAINNYWAGQLGVDLLTPVHWFVRPIKKDQRFDNAGRVAFKLMRSS